MTHLVNNYLSLSTEEMLFYIKINDNHHVIRADIWTYILFRDILSYHGYIKNKMVIHLRLMFINYVGISPNS